MFRNVVASGSGCKSLRYHQELSPRGTFYDIDTDPCDKLAVAVGQVLRGQFHSDDQQCNGRFIL